MRSQLLMAIATISPIFVRADGLSELHLEDYSAVSGSCWLETKLFYGSHPPTAKYLTDLTLLRPDSHTVSTSLTQQGNVVYTQAHQL